MVVERRWGEIRIARINGRAARQQGVSKRWSAVVLQRTKHRIGIDLIARPVQITSAIIAAEIIAVRGHRAKAAKDVVRLATVQDGVSNLDGLAIPDTTAVAEVKDPVVAESAIADRYCPNGVDTTAQTRLFEVPPGHPVAANSTIADRYCPTVARYRRRSQASYPCRRQPRCRSRCYR